MSARNPVWTHSLPAALRLMAPFDILASLAMDIYLPVVPEMPRVLGTTPAVIQLTLSVYMVLLGVGQLLFGPLADRLGRRPVLLGGGGLFAVASISMAASSDVPMFIMFRVLQALGASAMLVATFATVRDVYAHREEGTTIYAVFSAMLAFVPALGPILGALLAGGWGWRAIFIALGLVASLALANAARGWHETRPSRADASPRHVGRVLRSLRFWTYTLGFSAAMGTFFVFFSTAPRVLIERAGYAPLAFSLAFATVALVMVVTTRWVRRGVMRWGEGGCLARGMGLLVMGAVLLVAGQWLDRPSFVTFILPMWVSAVGIVVTVAVTANGALKAFDDMAGLAVAVYFCVESLLVGVAGTAVVLALPGDSAWPLIVFPLGMAVIVLLALAALQRREQAAS
ncbi:CmlA/FloR family chloramphenicol efflux MFS transporter [Stenotrophomonas sp. JAG2]|uniref:CmlA/FloR family chloramphenicol efflux MFS transporter n=1 Tax=Stenotrophomonas sp. JAG2 TaxID=3229243 RepID=UPI0034E27312